jgi:hypothetical protein
MRRRGAASSGFSSTTQRPSRLLTNTSGNDVLRIVGADALARGTDPGTAPGFSTGAQVLLGQLHAPHDLRVVTVR